MIVAGAASVFETNCLSFNCNLIAVIKNVPNTLILQKKLTLVKKNIKMHTVQFNTLNNLSK